MRTVNQAVRSEPARVACRIVITEVVARREKEGELHHYFAANQALEPQQFTGSRSHEWIVEGRDIPSRKILQKLRIEGSGDALAVEHHRKNNVRRAKAEKGASRDACDSFHVDCECVSYTVVTSSIIYKNKESQDPCSLW